MQTIDTTVLKTFANFTDMQIKTAGSSRYIRLSNGYHIPVTLAAIKKVATSMDRNNDKFCGNIHYLQNRCVQIEIK